MKQINSVGIIIAVFTVFIIFATPGNSGEESRSLIQKVEIVDNPNQPIYKENIFKMDLEMELKVEDKGKYILNRATQIILDDQKNIYVLDKKENNIKIFDPNGHYLLTIGKPGLGPGELNGVTSIFIYNNEIVAWCRQDSHLKYFDLNGKFLKSSSILFGIGEVKCDSRGNLFGVRDAYEGDLALVQLNNNLSISKVIEKRDWEPPKYYGVGLIYTLKKDDTIVVGNNTSYNEYEIKVFSSGGELIKLIRKEHRPMRVPREDIALIQKNNPLNWEILDYFMPFSRIYTNETGMIIATSDVRRNVKNEMTFDIFNKEGKYLNKIIIKSYYYYCLWDNARLYTIEENDEGYFVVRVYKIKWNI